MDRDERLQNFLNNFYDEYVRPEKERLAKVRTAQTAKRPPVTLSEAFKEKYDQQKRALTQIQPTIDIVRNTVLALRDELKSDQIGFEFASIKDLRDHNVQNAVNGVYYGLLSIKDVKFLVQLHSMQRMILCPMNVIGTHTIDASTCFNEKRINFSLSDPAEKYKLQKFIAMALGQLTALEEANEQDQPNTTATPKPTGLKLRLNPPKA